MNFLEMSEKQILDIATPIMDNLMQASTDIDHTRHVQDFTDRAKAIVTEDHLQKVCVKYQFEKGNWGKREPIAVLKRPDSAAIIWKQFCSKVEGEYVAEIVLIHQNGRFLVDHAMVF
jgi:succinyl-CoA synthetase beta subunit